MPPGVVAEQFRAFGLRGRERLRGFGLVAFVGSRVENLVHGQRIVDAEEFHIFARAEIRHRKNYRVMLLDERSQACEELFGIACHLGALHGKLRIEHAAYAHDGCEREALVASEIELGGWYIETVDGNMAACGAR